MRVEIRNDSVFIHGYVNAVERLSKPIRETLHGRIRTFLERIKAGVFRNALKKNSNVLVLLNHDDNRVLASTEDGSAVLEEDNIGLRAEITITDKEVVQKARDGKLSGWSFGFIANDDVITTEGNDEIRTVTDLDLLEVSILDDTKAPAYYGTSIETREGGARMKEIRADAFEQTKEQTKEQTTEQTEQPTISIEELADLVAAKVIEALKTEQKAEETEEETEEQTEEHAETEETEETEAEDAEEQTEEKAEDAETEEETEQTENEAETEEETEEQESRSIDYSAFEARLAKLMK